MKKDKRWKQPTPHMQLTAIVMSLEGHYSNFIEGSVSISESPIEEIGDAFKQLKQLEPFLKQGCWDDKLPKRVAFNVDDETASEIGKLLEVTEFKKAPQLYRAAFTLLRLHVEAAQQGKEVRMDTDTPNEIDKIILPFTVKKLAGK